jgi:hypothetical protein
MQLWSVPYGMYHEPFCPIRYVTRALLSHTVCITRPSVQCGMYHAPFCPIRYVSRALLSHAVCITRPSPSQIPQCVQLYNIS